MAAAVKDRDWIPGKEIATYLNRDTRTVQRWEKTAKLPIRRLQKPGLGVVRLYPRRISKRSFRTAIGFGRAAVWRAEEAPDCRQVEWEPPHPGSAGEVLVCAGSLPRLALWRQPLDGSGHPVALGIIGDYAFAGGHLPLRPSPRKCFGVGACGRSLPMTAGSPPMDCTTWPDAKIGPLPPVALHFRPHSRGADRILQNYLKPPGRGISVSADRRFAVTMRIVPPISDLLLLEASPAR